MKYSSPVDKPPCGYGSKSVWEGELKYSSSVDKTPCGYWAQAAWEGKLSRAGEAGSLLSMDYARQTPDYIFRRILKGCGATLCYGIGF